MSVAGKPVIAITMGDPCGIGPEVVAKALGDAGVYEVCRPVVVGSGLAMERGVELAGGSLRVAVHGDVGGVGRDGGAVDVLGRGGGWDAVGRDCGVVDVVDWGNLDPGEITVGQVNPACGRAAMEWVTRAGELAMSGAVAGLATAPLNKEAASLAGYRSIGHMELLQELSGAGTVATMLMARNLRVVHLTTHRSLRAACDYVKKGRILDYLRLTHEAFVGFGFREPRIAAAALNPHGSDGGLLGSEEAEEIGPAVDAARAEGVNAFGPVPADIVFHHAAEGRYDAVLAMYHDQGHIPVKVYGFEESITANLGLPFVRTSVDHGTAFDIAGRGVASPVSMLAAIRLAAGLAAGDGLAGF